MHNHNKLSENFKKSIIQETVGDDFTGHLEKAISSQDVRAILNLMVFKLIKEKGVQYISIDDYISFFEKIPINLWATKPVFYYKDEKYDALGLLGEKVHVFTLVTKTLDLYFSDGAEISITAISDNKEPKFIEIKNPKERFIAALEYLKDNLNKSQLKECFLKSKQITHGGLY